MNDINVTKSRLFKLRTSFSDINFKQVNHIQELQKSSQLLCKNYQKKGYVASGYDFLYLPQYLIRSNFLFVAKKNEDIVGTIGIVCDEKLPVYTSFSAEIETLQLKKGKCVEIGSLAICPEYQNQNLFYDLYVSAVFYAIFKLRAQHIFIQIDSKKTSFYERLFFQKVGESKMLSEYNGSISSLLYMDVAHAWKLMRLYCDGHCNVQVIRNMLKLLDVYERYKFLSACPLHDASSLWSEQEMKAYKNLCGYPSISNLETVTVRN